MCLTTYFFFFFFLFAITKDIIVFKIYFKSSIFSKQNAVVLKFEIVSYMKLAVEHQVLSP